MLNEVLIKMLFEILIEVLFSDLMRFFRRAAFNVDASDALAGFSVLSEMLHLTLRRSGALAGFR